MILYHGAKEASDRRLSVSIEGDGMTKPGTLYLHIGTHKTGTTAIQGLLTTRSETFARGGVFVPRSGRVVEASGHHKIAWEISGDTRYRPEFGTLAELCDELQDSPHGTAIVSSEDFEYLYCDQAALRGLKAAFEGCGYRVEVLMFLREQAKMIGSLYQELLKHGLDMGRNAFARAMINGGGFTMHDRWRFCLSYERQVAGFATVFGEMHVHCRRYERPVQRAFLDLLGHPSVGEIEAASHAVWDNKALPNIKVHALRRFNAWVSRTGVSESRAALGRQSIIRAEVPREGPDTNSSGVGSLLGLCCAPRWRGTNRWLRRTKGVRLDAFLPQRFSWQTIRGAYARLVLAGRWRIVGRLIDGARTVSCSQ